MAREREKKSVLVKEDTRKSQTTRAGGGKEIQLKSKMSKGNLPERKRGGRG